MFMLNPIAAGVMAAAAQEPPAPPIGCSITLTGDIGPIAGYAAADVSGQSFGITDAAPNIYMASTDFVNRRPLPAPGKKVWIQCDGFSSADGVGVWAGFCLFDASGAPIGIVRAVALRLELFAGVFVYGVYGLSIFDVNNPSNPPSAIVWELSEPVLPQYLSIAVDSEGEVFFYDQQAGEVVAASSIEPEWAGFFENAESMCLVGAVEGYSGSLTGTGHFTTAAGDMLDVGHLGGEDWCGNALPEPVPIGCTIALTGDAATAFGLPAADINGQTFSITDAAATVYLASTSISNRRAMPASGKKVWVQGSGTGGDVRIGFVGFDASGNAIAVAQVRTNGSAWALYTEAPAGDNEVTAALPAQSDSYSIGVGSDGEVYIYRRDTGTVVNVSAFGAPSGLFASAASLMLLGTLDCGSFAGATMSGTFTTDVASMTDALPGGDEDWCGNEIPAPPAPDLVTPDTIATEGVDVFYFNPSLPGTLWADRDGTTPAGLTVGSPVLRMDNLSSRTSENMVAPLDRSGFERSSTERLRKIDNTGVLALDSEFSEVEGITIALDVTTTGSGDVSFFGGGDGTLGNQIRVYRSSSNVVVYVHTHMHSFSGAMSASNPHSARLIATITQDAVTLYVNGKLHGTMPPNWKSGNPFSHICLGAPDKNGTANANATWGRVAVLKEALDATRVEKLDKWLALGDYSEEPVTVTATFDPAKTHEQITLSDGNRRASCTSTSRHYWTQLQPAKSSGKWFVEYLVHTASRPLLGVTHEIDRVPDGLISPHANGGIAGFFDSNARRINRNGTISTMGAGDIFNTPVAGDRITVAYDIDNLLFYLYRNGIPATDNPFPLNFEPAGPEVVPMARLIGLLDDIEIVTNPKWPIPGFLPWGDGSAPPDPDAWATLTTRWVSSIPAYTEPTIAGRTWSFSTSSSKSSFVEFADPPPAFSGRRAFEIQPLDDALPDSGSSVNLVLSHDGGGTVVLQVNYSDEGHTVWGNVLGSPQFEIPYVPGTSGALVVDGDTGDVEFWWDGVLRHTESGFFGANWISGVVSGGLIGNLQSGTVGAKIPLSPVQYVGTYDGASALNGEPLGETEPLPEFTFTLSTFENGAIVNNPGGGAGWHDDYVPPSVITVDEPDPVMSTSELAAWVEAVAEDADAQDEIPDGTEIGTSSLWWKWERKPTFFKLSGFVYYETLAEALADVSAGDTIFVCARTWNNTGGGDALPGPRPITSIALTDGEFEVAYTSPYAQFTVGEPE